MANLRRVDLGGIRSDIDRYDLAVNPETGLRFWEFESDKPFPDRQALTSLNHALIHTTNLMERIIRGEWSTVDQTIPEVFCIARRAERALELVASDEDVANIVGRSGAEQFKDVVVALIIASTAIREKVVHDSMHYLQADPSDPLDQILAANAAGSIDHLWAIGIDLADCAPAHDPRVVLRRRLSALAIRFSNSKTVLEFDDYSPELVS